jgi:hypothetical protein
MDNKTYRYLHSFTRAYIASTNIPAPTGNAKVIASWPTKTKSTLTVIQYQQKTTFRCVW